MKLLTLFSLLFIFSLASVLFPPPTHAYIDPGTGSFFLQTLLGLLLGGIFLMKAYWKKIISFFTKTSAKKDDSQNTA